MHKAIKIRYEKKRACGFRDRPRALYLVSGNLALPCGRLPIPLKICPVCGSGFKPARGYTWIDAHRLAKATVAEKECLAPHCQSCPVSAMLRAEIKKAGLIWIGEKFYRNPFEFTQEANTMGVCRRIPFVPIDFELGKTWILLAHRRAILKKAKFGSPLAYEAGIFQIFKPEKIEITCNGKESDQEIESCLKRGLIPVLVRKKEDPKLNL
ncbi:hypothetical protein ES705_12933 [subsurface metagenome]